MILKFDIRTGTGELAVDEIRAVDHGAGAAGLREAVQQPVPALLVARHPIRGPPPA